MKLLDRIASMGNISKNKAKQMIDSRCVFVNGKRVWIASFQVSEKDRVDLPSLEMKTITSSYSILFQDDYFLIVSKPPGIISSGPHSLETLLQKKISSGISAVHRLDKETSGALIFSKNAEARERMVQLFKLNAVKKTYLALVQGVFRKNKMNIDTPIDEQNARTEIRLLKAGPEASLLKLEILTGRTHQIRLHLREIGYHLLGEKEYFKGDVRKELFKSIHRQMLHAWKTSFVHPFTGVKTGVEATIPDDMQGLIHKLGLE